MDLGEAIDARRARRKYLTTPVAAEAVASLQEMIDGFAQSDGLRMELVLDDGAAFEGFRRSYGMFTGVRNYVGLIARQSDPTSAERLGYDGEALCLKAVTMGLGTCWVGGSFDRSACPFTLAADESIACVLVFGHIEPVLGAKEKLIRGAIHRRSKAVEEMYVADGPVPDWFLAGMAAVQKAPSAVNRQPGSFSYGNRTVRAAVPEGDDQFFPVELGIAKLHFDIGSGGGTWQWGNHGQFNHLAAAEK